MAPFVVNHHCRSTQVWHVFSMDLSFTCSPVTCTRSSAIRMSHTCLCLPSYSEKRGYWHPANPGSPGKWPLKWRYSEKSCRKHTMLLWTCKDSRFDSNSNWTSRFEFDSKVMCQFENFESDNMSCAVIPQTTLTHCSTKTSTFAPFVVDIYVYNSTLRVSVLM